MRHVNKKIGFYQFYRSMPPEKYEGYFKEFTRIFSYEISTFTTYLRILVKDISTHIIVLNSILNRKLRIY